MSEYLTSKEAADYLRLSYWYFLWLVRHGQIYHPAHTHNRKYRFKREWLDHYSNGGIEKPQKEKSKYKNF